jgi:hypothetical protein
MQVMSDDSQVVVPPSFIALYMEPGRIRPNASREEIVARYEFCEDLATMLVDHARTKRWELGVTEADVLERVHRGLTTDQSGVNSVEAEWLIRRLAELLGWDFARCESGSGTAG